MSGIKNLKRIALDSNIFIYNLEQNPQYVQFTDEIFKRLIANQLKAATNIVSLAEILSYPETEKVVKEITEDFFSTPNVTVFEVNQQIAIEAARIRRRYRFRFPDAIQLATAKLAKAEAFITNDYTLKTFTPLKVLLITEV
ncbi:MAG: PIN domain-containing protein [Candidatus Levybacteria bacterium]|nr:PIN domain-containing protein [Candidatus Levybacteria bacterium]